MSENGTPIQDPDVVDPLGAVGQLLPGSLAGTEATELRPMAPSETYCWLGVICCSISSMPSSMSLTSPLLMLPVRSATIATSIGFGATVPQDPLQATDSRVPVPPMGMPPAGAKANGTSRPWKTRIVLQATRGVPRLGVGSTHGIAQSVGPQEIRRPLAP